MISKRTGPLGKAIRVMFTIPSAGRPQRVKPMLELCAPDWVPTWVVPMDQVQDYVAAGADPAHVLGWGSDINVAFARNRCIQWAEDNKAWCMMVDDDLKKLRWAQKPGGPAVETTFDWCANAMVLALADSNYEMAGANSTDNAYFVREAFSTRLFIPSAWLLLRPSPTTGRILRFDERFKTREDYDLVCQHIDGPGGALRVNRILPTFDYGKLDGGMQRHRDELVSSDSVNLLMEKWPGWIRRNPKRPGEVLLRVPKARTREVMA